MIDKLVQLQALDLQTKIMKTKMRIKEWVREFGEDGVYVAFSGGKDSTVLLHIVRELYPNVPAVFVNTGLEYPEIVEFARSVYNLVELKPKMNFKDVITKYGYPVVSKEQSQFIQQYRTAKSEKTKNTRWNGNDKGQFKISEKWKPLCNADFKISEKCCDIMKKNPSKNYEKESGKKAVIGTMAAESSFRKMQWNKYSCNAFENKRPTSRPISFWLEKDIWEYIRKYNVPYSKIYDVEGIERTGCMFCGFGLHMQKEPNKFQLMEKTHPKIHKYCIENLGLGKIVDFMNENCKCNIKLNNENEQLNLFRGDL